MDFERGLFSEALYVLKKCWRWVAIIIGANFFVNAISIHYPGSEGSSQHTAIVILLKLVNLSWILLFYKAHATILGKTRSFSEDLKVSFGFLGRVIIYMIACLIPMLLFWGWLFIHYPELLDIFVSGTLVRYKIPSNGLEFYLALAAILTSLVLMIMLSTYLPAYVDQKNMGFRAAFDRGKRQWGFILLRSIVLWVVMAVAMFILGFVTTSIIEYNIPAVGPNLHAIEERIQIIGLWLLVPFSLVYAYFCAAVCVILSRAYLRDLALDRA